MITLSGERSGSIPRSRRHSRIVAGVTYSSWRCLSENRGNAIRGLYRGGPALVLNFRTPLVEDGGASSVDDHAVLEVETQRLGQHDGFEVTAAALESIGIVAVRDGQHLLGDDRAFV